MSIVIIHDDKYKNSKARLSTRDSLVFFGVAKMQTYFMT